MAIAYIQYKDKKKNPNR